MIELPSFTIAPTSHLCDIVPGPNGNPLTGEALTKSRVLFTSNLDEDSFVWYQGDVFRAPTKVWASVDENGSVIKDGFPVALLANSDDLSVHRIQWSATAMMPAPGRIQVISLGPFDAPAPGEVLAFSNIVAVPAVSPTTDPDDIEYFDGGEL